MLALPLKRYNFPYSAIAFSIAYVLIFVLFLRDFFKWDINFYVGLALAPYISNISYGKFSLRYLYPTLIALLLVSFIPVKTLFFIAVVFSAVLMIESCIGKLSHAFLLLAFLLSPVFKYLIATIDFPARLWLTNKVVDLLNFVGIAAKAEGNIIVLDKYVFAVDPACAGLNMLSISLILCLFIVIYYQRAIAKSLNFLKIAVLFIITIGLNILGNFFRILLLVLFKIMPETFFHDFVGVSCLLVYVIIPLLLGTKPFLIWLGKPISPTAKKQEAAAFKLRFPILHILILALTIFIGSSLVKADTLSLTEEKIEISGFKKQRLASGIVKFENTDALIYIKPSSYYVPGHDPKLCWTGSGYAFNNIRKEKISGVELYTAMLTKNKDRIYAAWWFDDGRTQTVSEFRWRWTSAVGRRKFYLVNVNAMSKSGLERQISAFLGNSKSIINTP